MLRPARFREIGIDKEGLFVRQRDGANQPTKRHAIVVEDHGHYFDIGCTRVSRAAWEYIASKVKPALKTPDSLR